MNALRQAVSYISRIDAPVLVQELRVCQRGRQPFILFFLYVLILSVVLLIFAQEMIQQASIMRAQQGPGAIAPSGMTQGAQEAFLVLMLVQLAIIALAMPSLSASAVSGEREKATFDLLALCPLSSSAIVTQKLAVAVAQGVMFVVVSVPVLATVLWFGGVSPSTIAIDYFVLVMTAALLGAIGMICSCWLARSRPSTGAAYAATLFYLMGAPVIGRWMLGVARVGLMDSMAASPFTFTAMFAITGGTFALGTYALLALFLRHKLPWWQTRAFRMAVFGGVYAGLLLLLTAGPIVDSAAGGFLRINIFEMVNPFFALAGLYDRDTATISWILTTAFACGGAYLLTHLSVLRFSSLRRT